MSGMLRLSLILVVGSACWAGLPPEQEQAKPKLTPADITPDLVQSAIKRGEAFLLDSQNPDGSWGGAADSLTTWSGGTWSNPESHRSWRIATTGLACLAMLEMDDDQRVRRSIDRSIDYLTANSDLKRPSDWDTMDCWGHIYGLQALAAARVDERFKDPERDKLIRAAMDLYMSGLKRSQSLSGGWGYLEFDVPRTERPQWATSFTTAAGLIALVDTRETGISVDADVVRRAADAVRRCWLPNGAYTYAVRAVPTPRRIGSINRVKGSLARIQSCNLALLMAGDDVKQARLRTGLEQFFREHRFLDIATGKPIPHETYYQNSGYFYFFGHYYAARVIGLLPAEEQREFWPQLQYHIIKMQCSDGSMWDYDHHAYDKPYGTAYGLMGLVRSLRSATDVASQPTDTPKP